MSKAGHNGKHDKKDKNASSPERLVLALIENAHFAEALVLLEELKDQAEKEDKAKTSLDKTVWLYASALANFGAAGANARAEDLERANAFLHQAFAANNFVLPLMVSRVNEVSSKTNNTAKTRANAAKALLPPAQHQANKYIDLWFGSWLQTENAFDWLGNQFVEWTKATKLERLKAQQEKMLANSKKLDIDFFLN